jgi:hypothetical protein
VYCIRYRIIFTCDVRSVVNIKMRISKQKFPSDAKATSRKPKWDVTLGKKHLRYWRQTEKKQGKLWFDGKQNKTLKSLGNACDVN